MEISIFAIKTLSKLNFYKPFCRLICWTQMAELPPLTMPEFDDHCGKSHIRPYCVSWFVITMTMRLAR